MNKEISEREAISGAARRRGARVVYDGVTKQYGNLYALHPTSLEIESGEFFSIIGPSGSGKTTLLGVTAGFIPPTDGQILVDGRDLVGIPPFQRNIGMVFQNYSLFPHMTVAQNIGFPLRMRKLGRAEADERIKRMLGVVRLGGMADRYPAQLSGGQQQRVALARAAVYDPVLLLMDEPLSALDKNLREEMQREIKAFQQALGATVIYVTHDQYEASSMSHRIAIMNGGRVAQIGSPRELYENPRNRFVASFLGEANLFEVRRHEPAAGNRTLVETGQGFRIHAAGIAAARKGLRPLRAARTDFRRPGEVDGREPADGKRERCRLFLGHGALPHPGGAGYGDQSEDPGRQHGPAIRDRRDRASVLGRERQPAHCRGIAQGRGASTPRFARLAAGVSKEAIGHDLRLRHRRRRIRRLRACQPAVGRSEQAGGLAGGGPRHAAGAYLHRDLCALLPAALLRRGMLLDQARGLCRSDRQSQRRGDDAEPEAAPL